MSFEAIVQDIRCISGMSEENWRRWISRITNYRIEDENDFNKEIIHFQKKINRYRLGRFDALKKAAEQLALLIDLLEINERYESLPAEIGSTMLCFELDQLPSFSFKPRSWLRAVLESPPDVFKQQCGIKILQAKQAEVAQEYRLIDLAYLEAYHRWLEEKLDEYIAYQSDHKQIPHRENNSFDIEDYVFSRPRCYRSMLTHYANANHYQQFPVMTRSTTNGMIWYFIRTKKQVEQQLLSVREEVESFAVDKRAKDELEEIQEDLFNAVGECGDCTIIDVALRELKSRNIRVLLNLFCYLQRAFQLSKPQVVNITTLKEPMRDRTMSMREEISVPIWLDQNPVDLLLNHVAHSKKQTKVFKTVHWETAKAKEILSGYFSECDALENPFQDRALVKEQFIIPIRVEGDRWGLFFLNCSEKKEKAQILYISLSQEPLSEVMLGCLKQCELYEGENFNQLSINDAKGTLASLPAHLWIVEVVQRFLQEEAPQPIEKMIDFVGEDLYQIKAAQVAILDQLVETPDGKAHKTFQMRERNIEDFYRLARPVIPDKPGSEIPSELIWQRFEARFRLLHRLPESLPINSSIPFLEALRGGIIEYSGEHNYKMTSGDFFAKASRFFSSSKTNLERQFEITEICFLFNLAAVCMETITDEEQEILKSTEQVDESHYLFVHLYAHYLLAISNVAHTTIGRSALYEMLRSVIKEHYPWLEESSDRETGRMMALLSMGARLGEFGIGVSLGNSEKGVPIGLVNRAR